MYIIPDQSPDKSNFPEGKLVSFLSIICSSSFQAHIVVPPPTRTHLFRSWKYEKQTNVSSEENLFFPPKSHWSLIPNALVFRGGTLRRSSGHDMKLLWVGAPTQD